MAARIMVINDTQEILELFREILAGEGGYDVTLFSYKPHILDDIKALKPDLIICDYVFGEEKLGEQLLQRLWMDRETAGIPVIICSGAIQALRDMEGHHAERNISILYKPFHVDELLNLVEQRLQVNSGNDFRSTWNNHQAGTKADKSNGK
jgi:DNA-binding NtrC family response regulator